MEKAGEQGHARKEHPLTLLRMAYGRLRRGTIHAACSESINAMPNDAITRDSLMTLEAYAKSAPISAPACSRTRRPAPCTWAIT